MASSGDSCRFARSGPDLGLLSYGRFLDLGGPEQAFSFRAVMIHRPALVPKATDPFVSLFVSSAAFARLRADTREA
jgi:hypothetical protein